MIRRGVELACDAISLDRFGQLGTSVLDISPRGGLLLCERDQVDVGELVAMRFSIPHTSITANVEAEVTRIGHGRREGDRGVEVGIRFTRFRKLHRQELSYFLLGWPPPVPRRAPYVPARKPVLVGRLPSSNRLQNRATLNGHAAPF